MNLFCLCKNKVRLTSIYYFQILRTHLSKFPTNIKRITTLCASWLTTLQHFMKSFQEMNEKFKAPAPSMQLFLEQTMHNIINHPEQALAVH